MEEPDNTNDSNRCSADEKARLTKVNALALGYIQKALGNYDEATFRKWFGVNNADQPDISVKTRIRQTYEFMKLDIKVNGMFSVVQGHLVLANTVQMEQWPMSWQVV